MSPIYYPIVAGRGARLEPVAAPEGLRRRMDNRRCGERLRGARSESNFAHESCKALLAKDADRSEQLQFGDHLVADLSEQRLQRADLPRGGGNPVLVGVGGGGGGRGGGGHSTAHKGRREGGREGGGK